PDVLHERPGEIEKEHVEEQMEQAGVHEHRGEELEPRELGRDQAPPPGHVVAHGIDPPAGELVQIRLTLGPRVGVERRMAGRGSPEDVILSGAKDLQHFLQTCGRRRSFASLRMTRERRARASDRWYGGDLRNNLRAKDLSIVPSALRLLSESNTKGGLMKFVMF